MALAIGLGVAGGACADTYLGEMPRSACAANGGYSDSTITSRDNNDPVASCYKQTPSWTPPPIIAPRPPPRTVMVPGTTTVTHTYRTVTVTPRTYAPTSSQVLQQNLGTLSNAIGIMGAFAAERAQQREAEQAEQQAEDAAREEQRRQQEEEAAAAAKAADDAGRDAMSNSFEPATNVADTSNPFNALKFSDDPSQTPRIDLAANAKTPEETEMLEPSGRPTPVQGMGLDSPANRADIDATVAGTKAALYPPSPTATENGAAEIYGPPAPGEAATGAMGQTAGQAQAGVTTPAQAQINPTTEGGRTDAPVDMADNTLTSTPSARPEIYGPPLPPLPPTPTTGSETTTPSTPATPQEQLALDILKNNPGLGSSASLTKTSGFGGEKINVPPLSQAATGQTGTARIPDQPVQVTVIQQAPGDPDLIPKPPPLQLPTRAPPFPPRPLYPLHGLASNLPPAKRAKCLAWQQAYNNEVQDAARSVSGGTPVDQVAVGSAATVQHDSYITEADNIAILFNSECAGL